MVTDDFLKLMHFAQLLQEVIPILGRYIQEEIPAIVADQKINDDHRQMSLPLVYYDDPLPNGFDGDDEIISLEVL